MMPTKHKSKKQAHSSNRLFVSVLCFVAVGLYIMPIFEKVNKIEPLAEPASLTRLEEGHELPVPHDEQFGEYLGSTIATLPPLLFPIKSQSILGVNASDKRIEVDLSTQKAYAFEGNNKVLEFLISSGKWNRTPTGSFTIWSKVRSQKMSGGSKERGTYYYLPNVPYVMFFYNDKVAKHTGFSFHGTYWHSNFGTPMSHGCINMRTEDAQALFNWATPVVTNEKAWSTLSTQTNPGTQVIIYGVAPKV